MAGLKASGQDWAQPVRTLGPGPEASETGKGWQMHPWLAQDLEGRQAEIAQAAPVLLQALVRVMPGGHLGQCKHWREIGSGGCLRACLQARAAVLLATGREQWP